MKNESFSKIKKIKKISKIKKNNGMKRMVNTAHRSVCRKCKSLDELVSCYRCNKRFYCSCHRNMQGFYSGSVCNSSICNACIKFTFKSE
jgi:hypothetical protein